MASLEEMIILLMSPESSARAPPLATPMWKLALGMGVWSENAAVHCRPMLCE